MDFDKGIFDSIDTLEDVSIATIASDELIAKSCKEVECEMEAEHMEEQVYGYTPEVVDCYESVSDVESANSDPIDIAADDYVDAGIDVEDEEDNDLIDLVIDNTK